jgi:hypothetical protein
VVVDIGDLRPVSANIVTVTLIFTVPYYAAGSGGEREGDGEQGGQGEGICGAGEERNGWW